MAIHLGGLSVAEEAETKAEKEKVEVVMGHNEAMLARKFKKFFKKTKAGTRQKQPGRFKNTERDQFTGCFKCGKMDHIIKNCPQLKKE